MSTAAAPTDAVPAAEDEGVSLGAAASAVANKTPNAAAASASATASAVASASSSAAKAAAAINGDDVDDLKEGQPYPDLIKYPDEPPPPPELWEIDPIYEWEREERGYMFEERIEKAEMHKMAGNEHFRKEEWDVALRRYKRAIYFCGFDEMQMHDFMDHHREQTLEIQTTSKLNLVQCIVKMTQLEHAELPEGSLERAGTAIDEVLQARPNEAKAHFRKGQLLMLQGDLPGARTSLAETRRLGGNVREAMDKLKELEKVQRQRERALYGGKIQTASVHKALEGEAAVRAARWHAVGRVAYVLAFPLIGPALLCQSMWSLLCAWWRGGAGSVGAAKAKAE